MKRITCTRLAFGCMLALVSTVVLAVAGHATPSPNGASIETRTFNDCPLSTVTTVNNYPAYIEIKDVMDPDCNGFANLHSFSFSTDGGATAAVFNNPANYRFGADFTIAGPGEGEGGLRISPWYGKFVDGRFMANATTGEIACFGGALPFYTFTGNHAITYVKGTTIRLEVTYRDNDLFSTHPASIQYRVIYNGNTYDSPELAFGKQNGAECDPNGLWGELNDARAGGYFQARANTGAALTASWANVSFEVLPPTGTPVANDAFISERVFNDCGLSTLTTTNNYPAQVKFNDVMDPDCNGFANLHGWSFSDDGGATAAAYHDNSKFHFFADFQIDGAGEGEGGLRISPWYGQFVDGRFMANATSGEIACFGGTLPFYTFTGNHGITYTRGTPIHLDVRYRSNDLIPSDPATIQYQVTYNGNTYDSGELPFGKQNAAECDPYYLWGMLNDGRVGGYFQARANTGAALSGTWNNIRYSTCPDPVAATAKLHPKKLNQKSKAKWITVDIEPASPRLASEIDVATLRLNGIPAASDPAPKLESNGRKLKVRFPRPAVAATFTAGKDVPALLSGTIGADCIEVVQLIDVKAPKMTAPAANAVLLAGSQSEVRWEIPEDIQVESVTLLSSFDGGVNWQVEAQGLPNNGHFDWNVANVVTNDARLAIVLMVLEDETGPVNELELAQTDPFRITSSLAVGPRAGGLELHGAVPNPARALSVSFSLPGDAPATLSVFDVNGRQVGSREVGTLGAGRHTVALDPAGKLPVGVYVVQLAQGAQKLRTRAIVVQ